MIIPLHVKSQYSWSAGTASPEQLVARAAEHGLPALALADLDNLYAVPRFHALCRNAGIRPITGVELRRRGSKQRSITAPRIGRVVLLAKHAEGYANLCRIISVRHGGAGSERARHAAWDPVGVLDQSVRGLFVMTDDPPTLERLLTASAVDRADLRLLLVRPSPADEAPIHEAAARHGVALVADPEIVLLDADDQRFHALLSAALRNRTLAKLDPADLEPPGLWFRSPDEHMRHFTDVPQAVEETARVAEQCQFQLTRGRPVVAGPNAFAGVAPEIALAQRCRRALARVQTRDRCTRPAYAERLEGELSTIHELGYAGYFMAAAEISDAAKSRDIALSARGSAVGSLVVHLLGISAIDPVAHGLYFERFLHSRRTRAPDIDLDVCSERRETLIRWVVDRFGRDRVALVGTLPSFQFDSAIRSGLKALGANPGQIERFVASVARTRAPGERERKRVPAAALSVLPTELREGLPLVARLIGKPRWLAIHPGGVVIADRAITDYVPVERGRGGLNVAQYDQSSIEQTGLNKLDLLGNRFLSQLQRARALRPEAPALNECPLDDPATLARIDQADTVGCFQIETPLLRALLTQIPVRSVDDCVAALALVRPGAAAGAAKREYLRFIANNRGHDRPPLYDEDLMEILSANAGISLAAADQLRTRIIDSRDPRELAEHERAYLRVAKQHGRDPTRARAAWQQARKFAGYSFCKAHAWSYASLAYQSAYYKTHHLVEFGCALLDSYGGAYPLRTIAADLQRSGAKIVPPSVNRSALASTLDPTQPHTIVLGLARVKHLSKKNATAIIELRTQRGDYTSLDDLTTHVRLTTRELHALIMSGACDSLSGLSAGAYPFAHEAALRALGVAIGHGRRARKPSQSADPQRLANYRALVRVRNELEFLAMHISDHPLALLRAEAQRYGCIRATEAKAEVAPGQAIRLVGLIAASYRQYLTFEDESGLLDAVIRTRDYPRLASVLTTPGPYLGEGCVRDDYGHRYVELTSLIPFFARRRS